MDSMEIDSDDVDSVAAYATTLIRETSYSSIFPSNSSFSTDDQAVGRVINHPSEIASSMNGKMLTQLVNEYDLYGISYSVPTSECRVDSPPVGGTGLRME